MNSFAWHMPVDMRFGSGVSQRIAADLAGRPCVVLAFDRAFEIGLQHDWTQRLGPALLGWMPAPHGPATIDGARRLAQRVWPLLQSRPDAVLVALGGGSVMDFAKLLRVQPDAHRFDKLIAALGPGCEWPLRRADLWLVPTTAGTGKEVLPWATLGKLCTLGADVSTSDADLAWAERAYVDPWLTSTCSAQVTLHAALQALANAMTALWSPQVDRMSETLACDAVRQVITKLPPLLLDLHDLQLRSELCRASMHAGMALPKRLRALPQVASVPLRWAHAQGLNRTADELLRTLLGCSQSEGPKCLAGWLQDLGVEVLAESDMVDSLVHDQVPLKRPPHVNPAPARAMQTNADAAGSRLRAWT